jgi:hypothetical protein
MRRFAPFVVALAVFASSSSLRAQTSLAWSGDHARPIPEKRVELGLFQNAHYGVSPRLELSLHPLWFFALPHLEAKALAAEHGALSLAVRARLAYPTWFLGLVSREGAGGLLPQSSKPPQAVQVEGELLGSVDFAAAQTASVALGLAVAPHASFTPQELPLLDFPFLYPRFAPLYTVLVPRAAFYVEGRIASGLHYEVSGLGFLLPRLPDVGNAWAIEQSVTLEYRFGDRVAVSAGTRLSEAKYAYATRFHYLPYADVRFGF